MPKIKKKYFHTLCAWINQHWATLCAVKWSIILTFGNESEAKPIKWQTSSLTLHLFFSVSRLLSFSCLEWQLKCGLASRPGCNRAWPSDCLKRLQRTHVTSLSPAEEQEVSEGGARRLLDDLALPPYHDLQQLQQRVISQGQCKKLTLYSYLHVFPIIFLHCSALDFLSFSLCPVESSDLCPPWVSNCRRFLPWKFLHTNEQQFGIDRQFPSAT